MDMSTAYHSLLFACDLQDRDWIHKIATECAGVIDFAPPGRPRALAHCCSEKLVAPLDVLLDLGASVDLSDLEFVHAPIVSALLSRGANPNHADEKGWSVLHTACSLNLQEVAICLLHAGADLHAKDSDGWSALDVCAEMGGSLGPLLLSIEQSQHLSKRSLAPCRDTPRPRF